MPVDRQPPKKQLRASRACDFCHKRSIKCHSSTDDSTKCQNCSDFDVLCTYERPMRRGRALPGHNSLGTQGHSSSSGNQRHQSGDLGQQGTRQNLQLVSQADHALLSSHGARHNAGKSLGGHSNTSTDHRRQAIRDQKDTNKEMPSEAWRAFAAASAATIADLVLVYLQVAYPIFPLFHQPTLLRNVREQNYLRDQGCFASVMAACALASARQRDGALHGTQEEFELHTGPTSSETYYAAAVNSLPKDLTAARSFDFLRACALLSITSIQYGDIAAMQLYLGHYFTLVAINRFHDEACWPKNTSNIEIEERRRLYWSVYTLDIYASIVWNGDVHSCSTNARVRYPTEVEDEYITTSGSPTSGQPFTWLRGWNFTTDLYLVLEQASNRLRARQSCTDDRLDVNAVFGMSTTSAATMLAYITARYNSLPSSFKCFDPPTGKPERDIFGFQAANIQATMLLLRMVVLCTDDDTSNGPDVQLKCNVAAELVAVFENIPTAYLCGISTPLIYHLAGIGTILGSVMENPLSETNYRQIRRMLLSIADLLARLERGLSRAADISKSLRSQVEQIDAYMRLQHQPNHMHAEPDHGPSFNVAQCDSIGPTIPEEQHEQGQHTADDQNMFHNGPCNNNVRLSGTAQIGVDADFFLDQWTGDVQLPPELLDDWLWPFDLQPESWSSLGL